MPLAVQDFLAPVATKTLLLEPLPYISDYEILDDGKLSLTFDEPLPETVSAETVQTVMETNLEDNEWIVDGKVVPPADSELADQLGEAELTT